MGAAGRGLWSRVAVRPGLRAVPGATVMRRGLGGVAKSCLAHWPWAPVLLLLDDLIDAADLSAMATGLPERFRLLVTTRLRLGGGLRELVLEPLPLGPAVRLLERCSGRGGFRDVERRAAETIAETVGGLPLALTLLARQLGRDPDLDLILLSRRLVQQGALASVLQGRAPELLVERGLAAGFRLSWEQLEEPEREMALCLGELAQAPVPWALLGRGPGGTPSQGGVLLKNLAVHEDGLGEKEAAEAQYREALEILEASWGREDPRSRDCRLTLEVFLQEQQVPPRRKRKGA